MDYVLGARTTLFGSYDVQLVRAIFVAVPKSNPESVQVRFAQTQASHVLLQNSRVVQCVSLTACLMDVKFLLSTSEQIFRTEWRDGIFWHIEFHP